MIDWLLVIPLLLLIGMWGVFVYGLLKLPPKKWWLVGAGVGVGVSLILSVEYVFALGIVTSAYLAAVVASIGFGFGSSNPLVSFLVYAALELPLWGVVFGLYTSKIQHGKVLAFALPVVSFLISLLAYIGLLTAFST